MSPGNISSTLQPLYDTSLPVSVQFVVVFSNPTLFPSPSPERRIHYNIPYNNPIWAYSDLPYFALSLGITLIFPWGLTSVVFNRDKVLR